MKKYIVALGLCTTLLFAHAGNTCSIYVYVHNDTTKSLTDVHVFAPWERQSHGHNMVPGSSFMHHAVGNIFSCHGWYYIAKNKNLLSHTYAKNSIYEKKNGTIIAHIVKNPTHETLYKVNWSHG